MTAFRIAFNGLNRLPAYPTDLEVYILIHLRKRDFLHNMLAYHSNLCAGSTGSLVV